MGLHGVVVVEKLYVSRSLSITSHKVLIAWWSLVLVVTRQHALDAHADTGDALNGTPALLAKQIETDNAVGVYVRVHGDGTVGLFVEGNFRGFCRLISILTRENDGRMGPLNEPMGYILGKWNLRR